MALPVPINTLITPTMNYDPMVVRPPNVLVPNEVMHLLPHITAGVMNEVTRRAQSNAARVFTYNLLSQNGWTNNYFVEAIQFVACYLHALVYIERVASSPDYVMNDAIQEALGLFTGSMIYNFPELRGYLQPHELDAVYQNNARLSTVQGYIGSFLQNRNMYQPRLDQSFNQAPPSNNLVNGFGRSNISFSGNANMMTRSMNVPQSLSKPSGFVNRDGTIEAPPAPPPIQPAQQSAPYSFNEPTVTKKELTKNDWTPTAEQPYRSMYNPVDYKASYIRAIDGGVIEYIQPTFENMIREKHTIVLLDKTYDLNGVVRRDNLTSHVEEFTVITPEQIRAAKSSDSAEELNKVHQYVYTNSLSDVFLASIIFEGRVLQNTYQKEKSKQNIYRCYGVVYTPMPTKESYRSILNVLSDCKSFHQLAEMLKQNGRQLQSMRNTEDQEVMDDLAIYLTAIDRSITEKVNSFIRNNLSLDVDIDSFTADLAELRDYLTKEMGPRYINALEDFQTDAIGSIITCPSEETEKALLNLLSSEPESGLGVSFIPTTYSLTYVNVTANELDIYLKDNNAYLIRKVDSPLLYNIAEAVFAQNQVADVKPTYDLLITQDNVIFKLYRGYLAMDAYLISKS